MSKDDEKILKFPEPKPPNETIWQCKACGHQITELMEKEESEGSKVLPINLGGMVVYVCPGCHTFQLSEEVFNEIMKRANSNIIT